MIGKIIKGKSFQGCLSYVMGKAGAAVIGMNMDGNDPYSLANEFSISWQLRPKLDHKVCHIILSLSPEEHLDNDDWKVAIAQYLKEMGFDNNQYVAVKHTDKENHEHIHLVTSRVRMDGSVVSDSWDWTRSQDVIRKLEQDFGLAAVPSSWECDRQEQTKSQIDKELETGKATVKRQLTDKIDAALVSTESLPDFIEKLNLAGIAVRVDRDRKGKPKGIAYKLDEVSMAGSSVGKAYSLPRILKRISSVPAQGLANVPTMASHISQIIREQVKAGMTMPQLLEQLRQSGIDAHVKYTRTKKIKGISYSLGNNSIQGNELGKEFSWGGLQKYLQVSYDPDRDRSIILEMQNADRKAVSQPVESIHQEQQGLSDSLLNELVFELEKQRSLKSTPEQSKNLTKPETIISPEQDRGDRAQMVAAICHQLLNELGSDSFGEIGRNSYGIQRSGDALTVESLRGDRQIILQVKGQEIEFANLSEFDIQQFEQAWQHRSQVQQRSIDSQAKIP